MGEGQVFYLLNLEDFEERSYSPEQKLIFNVIFRAIQDCVAQVKSKGFSSAYGYAQQWILAQDDHPFSFRWCVNSCEFSGDTIGKIRAIATGKRDVAEIQIGKIDKMHI